MKITDEIAERYPALLETVQYYVKSKEEKGEDKPVFFEDLVRDHLSIIEAEDNKLTWEFQVQEIHCNQLGTIHGGCVATLIDICSSLAVHVGTGVQWKLIGISTDLQVQYLRGLSEGETIKIVCDVQRVGKTLANIFTRIYDSQGRLCYSGSHTKFNIDSRL